MEENKCEQGLHILEEYFVENPPTDEEIIEILKRISTMCFKHKEFVFNETIYTDYDCLWDLFDKNLTVEQKEEFEYSDEDTKKDAAWRREYYDLPKNTIKGTYINYHNYQYIFDDNKKYLGYIFNMQRKGFQSEKFDINKLKIKLGI